MPAFCEAIYFHLKQLHFFGNMFMNIKTLIKAESFCRFIFVFIFFTLTNTPILAADKELGIIHISAAKSFADTGLLNKLIKRFQINHPNINIKVNAVGSLQAIEHVRNAQADLVITHYPNDELESVFDKFVQSSKIMTGSGGTGLGLAISKEIIEAHGGSISAGNHPQGC